MISVKLRILHPFHLLRSSHIMEGEDCDDPESSMFNHVPYEQVKQARLEAESKIAETYAWHWNNKNKTI